ncbi:flagellar biosynthesis repressor FlbT [Methylobacterium sp. E-041]|jgi:flagellar protein FlbT|uniref:flagellar biosynthesis repressor FlbT n=1 Tax=unclassified Methylobacterium TaxID=2615210 RepID=UPI0011C92E19|nr:MULTISPECIES: flagellar biosynthesis repressor FlbT [unclassified Methylobacterium]MCJ2042871.1 flagellar biosynthesis repressor FlbT [Methylobacterium sp. J-059]MCJ2078263.1 flagellar biosynthesis repressor FlbT [Methylobacterium sp. E-016]MCJ2107183.1 flagellar biosynthesis repressor FlbT [Methylobacterium sp. E-041]MCJ2111390.1 flagellar biosynthesis repressor FlbT [Methylobacterium sp. E-025]TXM87623.1 flagellar protein FlbT [Methylobacterium sp. WL116]
MALRIELKPAERLIINGALIRNGDRRSVFLVETQCKFLRESEIIREADADTPCKKLCVTLQVIYLADDPAEAENLFVMQSTEILKTIPGAAPYLVAIHDAVAAKQYHLAIKTGRKLIAYEEELAA